MIGPLISQSLWRKALVTLVGIVGFVLVYEVTMFDSRETAPGRVAEPTPPAPAAPDARVPFSATAYCKGSTTASGVGVRTGIAAADPAVLPVGSVITITTDTTKYNGIYTIMDTGPKVRGRTLDLYMWSCHEALAFGRKPIQVTVLRLGWNPSTTSPGLRDRLFGRREARGASPAPSPAPSSVSAPTRADTGVGGAPGGAPSDGPSLGARDTPVAPAEADSGSPNAPAAAVGPAGIAP